MTVLDKKYYLKPDVVRLAKDLLGKYLFSNINGELTGGIIIETEAYAGITDKASHAYNSRRTKRTEVMFMEGGVAYVYLCYGIHSLFNVVTNVADIPHAILIRGLKPVAGVDIMLKRRGKKNIDKTLCSGPGSLSNAMGIDVKYTGTSLSGDIIWIEDKAYKVNESEIISGPRIGVDYAEEDALLPYRFRIKS